MNCLHPYNYSDHKINVNSIIISDSLIIYQAAITYHPLELWLSL